MPQRPKQPSTAVFHMLSVRRCVARGPSPARWSDVPKHCRWATSTSAFQMASQDSGVVIRVTGRGAPDFCPTSAVTSCLTSRSLERQVRMIRAVRAVFRTLAAWPARVGPVRGVARLDAFVAPSRLQMAWVARSAWLPNFPPFFSPGRYAPGGTLPFRPGPAFM